MKIAVLSFDEVIARLRQPASVERSAYRAMYSSWLGGIVRDIECMTVPIDDHIVHRGDGVFEAIKCADGKIYALERHLQRLFESAKRISLQPFCELKELHSICLQTARAASISSFMIRVYMSRGPGDFGPNPYATIGSQLYVVITDFRPMAVEKYELGATAGLSQIAVKDGFFANVKSCNYLPNVLMKKEAVDRNLDFTVSVDELGNLAEGSTENFAIVSSSGEFLIPEFARTLRGVTAIRSIELSEALLKKTGGSLIRSVRCANIKPAELQNAREAMFLGTTIDCLPVTIFDGRPVGDGRVGAFCRELLSSLRRDMAYGPLCTDLSIS